MSFRRNANLQALLPALGILFACAAPWFLYAFLLLDKPAAVAVDSSLPLEEPAEKLIAFTFDDGPRIETTVPLLKGLAERNAKATFFLVGHQIEKYPALVEQIQAGGHQIGIHTYDHVPITSLSHEDFDLQVARCREYLTSLVDCDDFVLRPPYGFVDNNALLWSECPIVLWSIDPQDWADKDVSRIVNHIVKNATPGSVVLLHDFYKSTVTAALQAIDILQQDGYRFVTVTELFAAEGIHLQDGTVYRRAS